MKHRPRFGKAQKPSYESRQRTAVAKARKRAAKKGVEATPDLFPGNK